MGSLKFWSPRVTAISSEITPIFTKPQKNRLTSIFDLCLYLQLAREMSGDILEIILMIRRTEHTFSTFAAAAGRLDTRQGLVWSAAICLILGNMNYQPKPNGTDRSQQLT